jgi:undecaprenyl-diphosphatase
VLHRTTDVDRRGAVTRREGRRWVVAGAAGFLLVLLLVASPAGALVRSAAETASSDTTKAAHELTAAKAVVLGIVEGVTEFLPISSTGHLHVTERMLDVGTTKQTKDAADTYAITIQAGAILAVLLLFVRRIGNMVEGVLGRDETGRRLLFALVVAFVPSAAIGVVFEQPIKDKLYGAGPIVAAWFVGGVALLVFAPRLRELGLRGLPLESITTRQALIIGVAQIVALWPGTSRSLVTIVAALLVGLNILAAVEFSFLLGVVTLLAATAYEGLKNGKNLFDTYGVVNPLIGFVVAFVAAAVAVKWMVSYLQRHDLSIFGWYRIAVAVLTLVLLATNVI